MLRSAKYITLICSVVLLLLCSCEKEIDVDLPSAPQSLVVEACINQLFPNLNYVFISRTIDYFNPDLSLNGVRNAEVYITPGIINGNDTIWDTANRIQLFDINNVPLVESFLQGFSGIYFNPLLFPQVGVPYKLDIDAEGQHITGITTIPEVVEIDTVFWEMEYEQNDTDVYVTFEFFDGPEQNNYRLAIHNDPNAILLGWGSAGSFRTFDDQFMNNGKRPYTFFRPYDYGDTLNLYLTSIGRKEYLFWQSFSQASNNGGPFATPLNVKSNITGAIGSFTGYGVSFRRQILE